MERKGTERRPAALRSSGLGQTFSMEEMKNDTCTAERNDKPKHPYLENTIPPMEADFLPDSIQKKIASACLMAILAAYGLLGSTELLRCFRNSPCFWEYINSIITFPDKIGIGLDKQASLIGFRM
ncbi:hypothetical protein [Bacillus xiapuensis]|uniref:hypothetical protein n=1 Tax=Bacillus xiapuensis TaxID=2014075 RepID=UPI001E32CDDB|nr:hypothetical protein [Bacillus xiapuensis]